MQKTIWITGASSGIGREFARRYAAMGCRLILTARRADRLQALAKELHAAHGTDCRIETADLSRAEECSRLCEVLAEEHIDIFINNAGFGVCGSILETEEAREEEMIQVNVAAMARLFRAVVRKMHAQGGGTILNVASSAGLLPGGPYMAGYYAGAAQPGLRLRPLPRPGGYRVQRPRRGGVCPAGHHAGAVCGGSSAGHDAPQDHHCALCLHAAVHQRPAPCTHPPADAHRGTPAEEKAGVKDKGRPNLSTSPKIVGISCAP